MASANDILNVARGEIGVTEHPPQSNNVKYNTEYYGRPVYGDDAYPWCMVFVWWVFKHAGASDLFYGGNKTASCPTFARWAMTTGRWFVGGYKPGDIMIFRFSSSGYDHVGIVEQANSDGTYNVIEGNTSLTSDDNGGAVMRRKRYVSQIVGAYRPDYLNASKNRLSGCDVSEFQDPDAMDFSKFDFVMIRASYGLSTDDECAFHAKKVKSAGKLIGFYHYAHPERNSVESEAQHFASIVRPYLGKCILALDYEGKALQVGPKWAREWLDRVYELTGVKPVIYIQASAVGSYKTVLDGDYGLWIAHWGVDTPTIYPWSFWALWQYSDSNGKLDVDYFNGSRGTWLKYAAQKEDDPVVPEPEPDPKEDDEDMTQEKFNEMFMTAMKEYRRSLQDNDSGQWSDADKAWAVNSGLIRGSGNLPNGEPNYMWQDFLTREQAAAVYHRFYETFVK